MKQMLKALLRPLYRRVISSGPARAVLDRELRARAGELFGQHIVDEFAHGDSGAAYGVSVGEKESLFRQFQAITAAVESGTSALTHAALAREILSIPPERQGDVVECGAWKGASSAALSLVCALAGRRLKVCDSFQGLPGGDTRRHVGLHTGVYGHYCAGMFHGTLEEVRETIRRHGVLEVCDFIPGFFTESLAALQGPVAFAFLDVDLESSTRECLRAIWPLLIEEGFIYSDDAGDLDVVRVYFDEPWWRETLGCPAPGFVGSGCGLPMHPRHSPLGYTRKLGPFRESAWRKAPFLHYPDQQAP